MDLLLTGSTGALGPPLLEALIESFDRIYLLIRPGTESLDRRFASLIPTAGLGADLDRLIPVAGDVTNKIVFAGKVDVVIHAAADTRFRAPRQEQMRVNVAGTRNLIAWARGCSKLKRFVFISTTCIAGPRAGRIPESFMSDEVGFCNDYEASKWQAEQIVRQSNLPAMVVRLSTVIGSERTGAVHRLGAMHHAIRWMHRGLVPMVPGNELSTIDLISSELAAAAVSQLAANGGPEVMHIAAGDHAIPLNDLINFAVEQFRQISPAWRQGQIARPMIVPAETFELFRDSVHRSGDVLFRSVLDSVSSFLPGLLYSKVYETTCARKALGGPLPLGDWRPLLERVIQRCLSGDQKRFIPREVCLA